MTFRSLVGLTTVCLAGLAGPASALTIVQTGTVSASASATYIPGGGASASVLWTFNRFDPLNGELVAMSIVTQTTGHAGATDFNPYDMPWGNNPMLIVNTGYIFNGAPFAEFAPSLSYQKGPNDPPFIAPHGSVSYGIDFQQSINRDYTSGLGSLVGTGTASVSLFASEQPGSDSVGSSVSQTTHVTLTYTYRVPDSGPTAALFVPVVCLCVIIRRRRTPHRPTF